MISTLSADHSLLEVRVWGDLACFTRPEAKGERASYPILTPSAARGMLESIFWKPQIRWHVREIWLLQPIRWMGLMRKEVTEKASPSAAMRGVPFYVDEKTALRYTLALRDVAYVVRAEIELMEDGLDPHKYRDQFQKRVERGACGMTPYLGCREMMADFSPRRPGERPLPITAAFGRILHDIDYKRGEARFFEAETSSGVMHVPNWNTSVAAPLNGDSRAEVPPTPVPILARPQSTRDQSQTMAELRAENARLREEHSILAQATAILARNAAAR